MSEIYKDGTYQSRTTDTPRKRELKAMDLSDHNFELSCHHVASMKSVEIFTAQRDSKSRVHFACKEAFPRN